MAYATAVDLDYAPPEDLETPYDAPVVTIDSTTGESSWFLKRSPWLPLPFLLPVALCGVSWMAGGLQFLTDLGFVMLTALCALFLVVELVRFPQRFGIGGFVAFGGILIWYCHDYFYSWFNYDGRSTPFPSVVIAKTTFLVALLTFSIVVGLNIRPGRWLPRVVSLVPEAGSSGFYLCLLLFLFSLGLVPYFFFAREPFYKAIFHDMFAMRSGRVSSLVVGRSGDYNTAWGAYILHLFDIGYFSGMIGAFYATLIARRAPAKLVGWACCLFWTLMAFGSGTRGYVVGIVLPAMGFLYIKYHIEAAALLRRTSVKAYVVTGTLAVIVLVVVQFQGMFRRERVEERRLSELSLSKPRGNHMFSEGLLAASIVPSRHVPFFANRFFGEGAVRIIPEMVFYAVIHPIPRALWPSKPHDEALDWYNRAFTGERRRQFNTTIAPGLAVSQYMRYGLAGVVEFGLVFGWLLANTERLLRSSQGRPIQILISLALSVWLFRCFRGGLGWMEFYELVIGITAMSLLVIVGKPFLRRE